MSDIMVTRELLEGAHRACVNGRFRTWYIMGKWYRLVGRSHFMGGTFIARPTRQPTQHEGKRQRACVEITS